MAPTAPCLAIGGSNGAKGDADAPNTPSKADAYGVPVKFPTPAAITTVYQFFRLPTNPPHAAHPGQMVEIIITYFLNFKKGLTFSTRRYRVLTTLQASINFKFGEEFLVKAKKQKQVTHEEIHKALKKFRNRGGLITHLPDQVTPRNVLVGAKWSMYEPISGMTTGVESSTG